MSLPQDIRSGQSLELLGLRSLIFASILVAQNPRAAIFDQEVPYRCSTSDSGFHFADRRQRGLPNPL